MSPKLRPAVVEWRSAIADSGLPRDVRAVAWALANYMNARGESAFPSVVTLCSDVGNEKGTGPASKQTVIKALQRLADEGWLLKAKRGGGRGIKSEWHARVPQTVHAVNRLDVPEDDPSSTVRDAVSRSLSGSDEAPDVAAVAPETVHRVNPSPELERVRLATETVHVSAVNGAPGEPEVVRTKPEVAAAGGDRVSAAAAELLDHHLKDLGVGAALRRLALADPLRAKAWLDLAETNAESNVVGYFRRGLESGEWPSPRIDREGPKANRQRWAYDESTKLALEDAYVVADDWPGLDDVERQELREWVDDARAREAARKEQAA